jgi:hypothetical protein
MGKEPKTDITQHNIAKQILISNSILLLLVFVLYLFQGFDQDEISGITALLISISSIYVAPVIQFIGKNLNTNQEGADKNTLTKNIPYGNLISAIIILHFFLVCIIIIFKALPIITYFEMNIFLGLIEVSFGTYISHIISSMYKINTKEQ